MMGVILDFFGKSLKDKKVVEVCEFIDIDMDNFD